MEINTSKVLKGFVEYKESTYPFFYENGLLNIMPNTKEKWNEEKDKLLDSLLGDDTYDLDWIIPEQIKGKLSDGDEVLFSVSGISSNDNGFIGFDVDKIFTYNPDFISTKNISGIRVYGDEINYFLNPAKTYQCEIKFNKINTNIAESLKISSEFSKLFDCGIYTYNDVDINIRIEIITSLHSKSSSPTSSRSQLKFDFSNTVDINFVYDTIHHCNKFFKYICGRTNINLNEFVILNKEKRKSGNVVLLKHIEKEFSKNRQNKIIKYDYLTTNTAKLFHIISGPEMYYEHLQSSISEKNKYTISRIITTMVAFEREFRNIYSDTYKRSDKFYESRNEVVKAIESLKENSSGKKKKYLSGFIGTISKSENSFSDKLKYAVNDCFNILNIFFPYDYNQLRNYNELSCDGFENLIDSLASRMNKLRNDSAHGNIDLKIDPIDLKHINTLENLLFAMRLKKIGISEIDIKKAIKDVNEYPISIN